MGFFIQKIIIGIILISTFLRVWTLLKKMNKKDREEDHQDPWDEF